MTKCLCCGVEKDMNVLEIYPYPESDRLCDDPIVPLIWLEVQSTAQEADTGFHEFRKIIVCHHCFEKLDPDMWISEQCLQRINCITPFTELPISELQ